MGNVDMTHAYTGGVRCSVEQSAVTSCPPSPSFRPLPGPFPTGSRKTYILAATSPEEAEAWVSAIREASLRQSSGVIPPAGPSPERPAAIPAVASDPAVARRGAGTGSDSLGRAADVPTAVGDLEGDMPSPSPIAPQSRATVGGECPGDVIPAPAGSDGAAPSSRATGGGAVQSHPGASGAPGSSRSLERGQQGGDDGIAGGGQYRDLENQQSRAEADGSMVSSGDAGVGNQSGVGGDDDDGEVGGGVGGGGGVSKPGDGGVSWGGLPLTVACATTLTVGVLATVMRGIRLLAEVPSALAGGAVPASVPVALVAVIVGVVLGRLSAQKEPVQGRVGGHTR